MFSAVSSSRTTVSSHGQRTKQEFKTQQLTGLYQRFNPRTGLVLEEGKFQNGQEVGIWKQYDDDRDEVHYQFSLQRIGALCRDGTRSRATGGGTCSWHGGVAEWLYDNVKTKVGGTGKYIPIETRLQCLRQRLKQRLHSSKYGLEFEEVVLKLSLDLLDQKDILQAEAANQAQNVAELEDQLAEVKERQKKVVQENQQLKLKIKEFQATQVFKAKKQEVEIKPFKKNKESEKQVAKQKTQSEQEDELIELMAKTKITSKQDKEALQEKTQKKQTIIKKEQKKDVEPKKEEQKDVNISKQKEVREVKNVKKQEKQEKQEVKFLMKKDIKKQEVKEIKEQKKNEKTQISDKTQTNILKEDGQWSDLSGQWQQDEEEESISCQSRDEKISKISQSKNDDSKMSSNSELVRELLEKLNIVEKR